VLALEVDPRATEPFREALRVRERRRPARVRLEEVVQLVPKSGVAPRFLVSARKLLERRHERLRHEAPPERAETPLRVGLRRAKGASGRLRHHAPPSRTPC